MHRGRVTKIERPGGGTCWRFEVDGVHPVTGRRRRTVRSGFGTKKAAQDSLAVFLRDRAAGRPAGRSPRLGAWLADEWRPVVAPTLVASTARLYTIQIRVWVAREDWGIGGFRLDEITPAGLTGFYGVLGVKGKKGRAGEGPGPLAPKTIRNVHVMLHRALRDATRWGLLGTNPAAFAEPPRVPRGEAMTWTAAEVEAFLAAVAGDRLAALWRVLATTGLRRGEALGLKWSDVGVGHLTVVRALVEVGGVIREVDTKTQAGRRRVALDLGTSAGLRDHRRAQVAEQLAWGEGYQDGGLVFTREDGSPVRPASVTRALPALAAAAGLPRLTPHGLRHTWATLALASGVNPKVVAERLGHASVQITLDRYSHVTEGLDLAAAVGVAALIDGARR